MKRQRLVVAVVLVISQGLAGATNSTSPEAWVTAIQMRDVGRLSLLLENGFVDINLSNKKDKTALMVAAQAGDLPLCLDLVAAGARINVQNENGGTPLMHAAVGGNPEIVSLLLSVQAQTDTAAVNGWTALALAAAKGHVAIVGSLLRATADPNLADIFGWTPLMHAVEQERGETVALFLGQPDIRVNLQNLDGVTALHRAVAQGFREISGMLVKSGARIDLPDQTGRTAVNYAREAQQIQILKDLGG